MTTVQELTNWQVISQLAADMGDRLRTRGWTISTAESCTGGLIAGAITDIAGSSEWFERGVVTYSNEVKHALLDVALDIFEQHGAVSEACVSAMATGALEHSGADVAVSVSGIAGPGGATPGKPVGTVWIGWAIRQLPRQSGASSNVPSGPRCAVDAEVFQFDGDRCSVRQQAVLKALRGTISRVDNAGLHPI